MATPERVYQHSGELRNNDRLANEGRDTPDLHTMQKDGNGESKRQNGVERNR